MASVLLIEGMQAFSRAFSAPIQRTAATIFHTVVEIPGQGQQPVLEVGPHKVVTEPVTAARPQTPVVPEAEPSSGVPTAVSNETTAPIPAGEPSCVETIGNYKIVGTKALRGDVFERDIGSIVLPKEYEKDVGEFLRLSGIWNRKPRRKALRH